MKAHDDPRQLVAGPAGSYYGDCAVDDTTLVPAGDALLGGVRSEDRLERHLAVA